LVLNRDSSSPADNDNLGNISFQGKNSAGEEISYARIATQLIDATDGTEDGRLQIRVVRNGTGTGLSSNSVASFTTAGIELGPSRDLIFEGATNDDFETTLTVTDPTADRMITLPDASGDVLLQDSTTGLFNITASTAGTNYFYNSGNFNYLAIQNSVSGTGSTNGLIMGATSAGNAIIAQRVSNGGSIYFNTDDSGGTYATRVTIGDTDLTLHQNMQLVFEGATDDNFETTLTVTDPTADRTFTLPDESGTVATRSRAFGMALLFGG
jgi:hypothetical protein